MDFFSSAFLSKLIWCFAVQLEEESNALGECSRSVECMPFSALEQYIDQFEEKSFFALLVVKAATLQRRYNIIYEKNNQAIFN